LPGRPSTEVLHQRPAGHDRHDLARSGFLRLLRVLQTVFLQDSVVLRPLFQDHPVWKAADVLTTDAYRAFTTRVTAACEAAEEPEDLQIKKALPVVNDRLNMMQAEVKMLRANVERVEEKVDRVGGKVDKVDMRHDRLGEKMDKLAADIRVNAFLDFVGVVNRQLQKKDDHRFFSVSVTAYAGRAAGVLSYETFNVCCVLLPGDRWKKVEPRTGRTVQVQGNSHVILL
jgi:hypothetical protein